MTDVFISGGHRKSLAIELLGAALALDLDASVVRTTSKGFRVPSEVADAAGYGDGVPAVDPVPTSDPADSQINDGVIEKVEPALTRPKDTDNKDAWVDYAKSLGATDETLTGDDGKVITKGAIIALFGKKE